MGKQNKARAEIQNEKQLEKQATLSCLRQDSDLWYRIHVLLYDLSKVTQDPQSEKRLSSTLHPLYISEPYFSDPESTRILQAKIDNPTNPTTTSPPNTSSSSSSDNDSMPSPKTSTIEQAIYEKTANFLTKRKASGDARPCGPHDLVPIYSAIFRISKDELDDESFLARVRRSGLGERPKNREEAARNGSAKECTKGQKEKKKDRPRST